ncbi:glutathione peroxidase [Nocardioides sp. GCM10027113]|uniref:glutathione peroxidase n=1 Tax=unclassified Nocardioides TaxID=2615069 RepID=UPI00360DF06E
MTTLDCKIARLDGTPGTLGDLTEGRVTLLVNVASRCGLTPQYTGLEGLQETLGHRGFTVVGVPCNQFGAQEPGSPDEIAEFCSATYGVSFPMTEKVEVNGDDRHELYHELVGHPDQEGRTGDVSWNFEKFLLDRDGTVVARFAPGVEPADPQLLAAVERLLA